LGQLKNKKVGNAVQQMDYKYNIRGWLTQINDPEVASSGTKQFSMKLHYTDPVTSLASQAQYNGYISSIQWRTPVSSGGLPRHQAGLWI
jgi:hypothetical protein